MDYMSKEYKEEQQTFLTMLKQTYGKQYDKYLVEYLKWRQDSLYKAYRGINTNTPSDEAKATATRLDGGITVTEELLKRIDG